MAKSIVVQILDGQIDTVHRGTEVTYNLPEYYNVDKATLLDKDALVEFLDAHGVLLGILHGGYRDDIISCRAIGRPSDKDGVPQPVTETFKTTAQEKILEHKPSEFTDPDEIKTTKGASKAVAEVGRKMAISFAQAGTPWDVAEGILAGAGFIDPALKDIYERALLG